MQFPGCGTSHNKLIGILIDYTEIVLILKTVIAALLHEHHLFYRRKLFHLNPVEQHTG